MWDVRAALSGLDKLLQTVIAASNAASNIALKEHAAMSGHVVDGKLSSAQRASASIPVLTSTVQAVPQLLRARLVLRRLITAILPQHLPSLQVSAIAYVGGYTARIVRKYDCENCIALCTKPVSNHPILPFTESQYPRWAPIAIGSTSFCSGPFKSFC